eukprot:CAMPEP_0198428744 /NCGR_PEP_ID=MMETSP1452-20131203/6755_1 /TAXON_ID=1181717 /ORGANISM="Synchroma pusillum, Strain CCMP3072" /LENGTH=384 /DNA_ID=CAMNT_0044149141 /DNA_START=65 /DNA_END=1219 /DNA_ORIENTATION=+
MPPSRVWLPLALGLAALAPAAGFVAPLHASISTRSRARGGAASLSATVDLHHDPVALHAAAVHTQYLLDVAAQGLADAAAEASKPGPFKAAVEFTEGCIVSLHDVLAARGVEHAYGPAIMLFTVIVRTLLSPVTYLQLESAEKVKLLAPKIEELKEKFGRNNNAAVNEGTQVLYEKAQVNPFAGCLPSLAQIPVFICLYRAFRELANDNLIEEPFLWIPNLEGPVYGEQTPAWLFQNWQGTTPPLGWHDTLLFMSIPAILVLAQTVSMRLLSPPADTAKDPAAATTNRILAYLPLMIGWFSLSVPAGLGLYWITNNVVTSSLSLGVKQYLKANPPKLGVDLDTVSAADIRDSMSYVALNKEEMIEQARMHAKPSRAPRIPAEFV